MKVELVSHTQSPSHQCAMAARTCYCDEDVFPPTNVRAYLSGLKKAKHLSVFEHAAFTFHITDVSRVLTHQLVRHRIASYAQKSQRKNRRVDFEADIVVPDTASILFQDREMREKFEAYTSTMEEFDNYLDTKNVPAEDRRYFWPAGMKTAIRMTINGRSLMNFLEQRLAPSAQWEIRELASKMLRKVIEVCPEIEWI